MAGPAPLAAWDPLVPIQALTDPTAVTFIAQQLNDGTLNQNVAQNAPTIRNLDQAIVDIRIGTTAQGAGTLEVHLMDPYWSLLTRWTDAPAFIDCDDSGLLIPVDVNFPLQANPNGTDMWWRICAAEPSLDQTAANLVLTFEDRIATLLRDDGGPKVGGSGQDRAQFIASCVKQVPSIIFVCPALDQKPGSVGGNLTQGQINTALNGTVAAPKSATNPNAPKARRNPSKKAGIGDPNKGATYVPGVGWRYSKPIGGLSPKVLDILNPPTNQVDGFDISPGALASPH